MKRFIVTLGLAATAFVFPPFTPNRDISSKAPSAHSDSHKESSSGMLGGTRRESFVWPTGKRVPILRSFSPPSVRWGSGHRGVDLRVEQGAVIHAAGGGVVVFAGKIADRSLVSIEHTNGLRTTYEPVDPMVSRGDLVLPGQNIGTLASGHCGLRDCLHWGAKYPHDSYINPLTLVIPQIRLYE